MGIKFHDIDLVNEKVTYQIVPEETKKEEWVGIDNLRRLNADTNGYSKDKSIRLIGRVPFSIYWNYAKIHDIKDSNMQEFYTVENGKNMKRLLQEFPYFKVVDQL